MPAKSKKVDIDIVSQHISQSHPFLDWYGNFGKIGIMVKGNDVVLPTSMSSRFVLGVESDGAIVLGVHVQDAAGILSISWTEVSLVRKVNGRPWIVLSNVIEDDFSDVKPVRLFIPCSERVSNKFSGLDYNKVRLRRMQMVNGKPAVAKGKPQAELKFAMYGYAR